VRKVRLPSLYSEGSCVRRSSRDTTLPQSGLRHTRSTDREPRTRMSRHYRRIWWCHGASAGLQRVRGVIRHMRLAATDQGGCWPCSAMPGRHRIREPRGAKRRHSADTDACASFHRDRVGVRTSPTTRRCSSEHGQTPGVSARNTPTVPLIPRCAPSRRACGRIGASAEHPSALGLRPDVTTGVATQIEVVEMDDAEPRQLGGTVGALEAAHRRARLGNLFSSVVDGRFEGRLG
jgi:hypothetical protein